MSDEICKNCKYFSAKVFGTDWQSGKCLVDPDQTPFVEGDDTCDKFERDESQEQ